MRLPWQWDRRSPWAVCLLAVLILFLNLWLNAPLFMPGELPFRGSVEGGYVGTSRFLSQHPNPWGWNPLPMALLTVWLAGKRGGYRRILPAAVLLAAIPLTNWVATFALAISCLLLLLAAPRDKLGFVVLHPTPAATTQIELHSQGTLEQRIMAARCALAWIASLAAFFRTRHA